MHELLVNKIIKFLTDEGFSNFTVLEAPDHKLIIDNCHILGYVDTKPKIEIKFS